MQLRDCRQLLKQTNHRLLHPSATHMRDVAALFLRLLVKHHAMLCWDCHGLIIASALMNRQGGAAQVDDEGAEGFARLLVMIRGVGAVGTTAIECKAITPPVLVDMQKVGRNHTASEPIRPMNGSNAAQWRAPCDVVG